MDLKTTVEKFYDDVNKKRINENGLSEAFIPVAEKILSCYFKVSKNRSVISNFASAEFGKIKTDRFQKIGSTRFRKIRVVI